MESYFITPIKQGTGDPLVNITEDRLKRLPFSYLHGILERKAGYDIYCFIDNMPTEEGIYNIIALFPNEEIKCMAFLWDNKESCKGLQGLIVANDDVKYYTDAKEKYNKKVRFI